MSRGYDRIYRSPEGGRNARYWKRSGNGSVGRSDAELLKSDAMSS